MTQNLNNLPINIVFDAEGIKTKLPILFLHGFTGSSNDWEFIVGNLSSGYTPIFIDLIGHGSSSSPPDILNYSEENQIKIINDLLEFLSIKEIILVGYSMGGRLALSFTINYPRKVKALVLESSSFGIEDQAVRKERILSDNELAKIIENKGIINFINFWMNIPLFESMQNMSSTEIEKLKKRKISENNIVGLKNSLIGFSQGNMNYLGNSLKTVEVDVFILAGELDEKYCRIAEDLHRKIQNSKVKIVSDCGHNVHFEKPEEFLKFLNGFLQNIRDRK
jgi:2-succinyl-6-hydroxy-2,4-cyclohexadiene-1-carboxylate synthase